MLSARCTISIAPDPVVVLVGGAPPPSLNLPPPRLQLTSGYTLPSQGAQTQRLPEETCGRHGILGTISTAASVCSSPCLVSAKKTKHALARYSLARQSSPHQHITIEAAAASPTPRIPTSQYRPLGHAYGKGRYIFTNTKEGEDQRWPRSHSMA